MKTVAPKLQPVVYALGASANKKSRADWARRLKVAKGATTLAPITKVDPRRDVVLLVPGLGMNFQDIHALAKLNDTYQVIVAVTNQDRANGPTGRSTAKAVAAFMAERQAIAKKRGLRANTRLRVIGHSNGGLLAQHMLTELDKQELIGTGKAISNVDFLAVDAPWRGIDLPWVFSLPGIRSAVSLALRIVPKKWREKLSLRGSMLSLINGVPDMRSVASSKLSKKVRTDLITVMNDKEAHGPFTPPINNAFSAELAKGELNKLWHYFRSTEPNPARLSSWKLFFYLHNRKLENLVRSVGRDKDYKRRSRELRAAARRAKSPEAFRADYDRIMAKILDRFEGQHTRFMWEDPTFMPYLRQRLTLVPRLPTLTNSAKR